MSGGSRIFVGGGGGGVGANSGSGIILQTFFAKNCMKIKEFGPQGRPWLPLGSVNGFPDQPDLNLKMTS